MNVLRALIGVLGLALLGLILWAAFAKADLHGSFMDQLGVITTLPWGIVSLFDLYVGFFFFSVIVFLTERSWLAAAAWAAPIFIVGNVWSALWLLLKLPSLARRLSRTD
ncbi:MAG: hypothetical protein JNM59_07340 [Hyphomonadaceae bacterium]|nr:hypothetical protein [Hyphomonadaceae bacterium]